MNEFEKIIVTNINTFQFKPDLDMLLVTENNAKPLEKIFERLEYRWVTGTKMKAHEHQFLPGRVLFIRDYHEYDRISHGSQKVALEEAAKFKYHNPDKPYPASEYIFPEY